VTTTTQVHLVRHGEVHNPAGTLYGRMAGFHLSDLGHAMAERTAQVLGQRRIVTVVSSPLERAQETALPLAERLHLDVVTDERVTEASSVFEGRPFAGGHGVLREPLAWRHLWNPVRPSWGEPYTQVVARMMRAIDDVRRTASGHEAVIVSHQLPIWATRLHVEGRSLLHDPRRRACTLCSVTSLTYEGDRLVTLTYSEPAADLLPRHEPPASGRGRRGRRRTARLGGGPDRRGVSGYPS
jgi:broad specificity phosphatase PhoE